MKAAFAGLLASALALALATPATPVHRGAFVHGTLAGNQISVARQDALSIPAAESAYITHGWSWPLLRTDLEPGWLELTAAEQEERANDEVWRFELYTSVNGGPVQRAELKRSFHFIGVDASPHFTKVHYLEIPAGTYAPQTTVTFTGIWYGDSEDNDRPTIELTRARTVTFR